MKQLEPYFTFKGRVSRRTFWANVVAIGTVSFLLSLWCVQRYTSFDYMSGTLEEHTYITHKPIYYAWLFVAGFRVLSISVRRWQDLGKSGKLAALNLGVFLLFMEVIDLPDTLADLLLLLSAVLIIVLFGFQGFVPGHQESNQYGSPPMEGGVLVA
jgi:uncharacterized membrane protein YhaH (DUF805 family)